MVKFEKRWLAGGASIPAIMLVLSSATLAAKPDAKSGQYAYDWSGFYAGGFLGYGDIDTNGFFATSLDLTFGGGGIFAGGRVGWNWQHKSMVIGFEHDASWLEWGATNLREEQYVTKGDFLSTARVRVGWADDNVLVFLTGGAAYLHTNVETSLFGADPDQQDNEDLKDVSAVGGVVGAGVEWGLSRNVSITAEGQYLFFGKSGDLSSLQEGLPAGPFVDPPNPPIPAGVPANHFDVGDGFLFKLGVNWRLWNPNGNGGGPGAREDYEALWDGPYEWGGFYAGSHVGIGKIDVEGIYDRNRLTEVTNNPAPIVLDEFNSMGLLGGFQAGYNVQIGRIVAGIEADVSGADWDDLFTDLQRPSSPQAEQLNIGMMGTLRGRAGFAYRNLLMYGTAGVAYLDGEYNDVTFKASKDISTFGGVYGAGIEWGFTPELSVKAEALRFHFNDRNSLQGMPSGVAGDYLKLTEATQFRVGANWHFGPRNIDAGALADMRADDYDWTGIYGGAHVGWGGVVTEGVYNTDPLPNQAVDLTTIGDLGVVAGGQAGLNWQSGPLVLGVEADMSYVDWGGREGVFYSPNEYVQFNSDRLATLRGRVGYADDNLLFYITGGLSWLKAQIDNSANLGGSYLPNPADPAAPPIYTPNPNDPGQKRNINTLGGVAGLGVEWGITQNLSTKIEGQYLFFNDIHDIANLGSEGDAGDFFQLDDAFLVKFGVNYRFNPFYQTAEYVRDKQYAPRLAAEPSDTEAGEENGEPEAEGGDGEKVGWSFSATLNRATVLWNDGDQTGVNSVDNPQDSSAVEATYRHALADGWRASATATIDAYYVGGDSVDQLDWEGTGVIVSLPYLFGSLESENFGRIIVGMSDSASDEIDNINLAGADVVSDASFDNFAASYFMRAKGVPGAGGLTSGMPNAQPAELRWGDVLDGKIAGDSGRFITYISPEWNGFEASAAIGLPTEIFLNYTDSFLYNERTHGVYWDAALRYASKVGSDFLVEGGIGYWNDTTEDKQAVEPTENQGVGGSLAVRHEPTGINLAINFGAEEHTDKCADRGAITNKCAGPDKFINVKGGIIRDIVSFGRTSFYGEFYKNWKNHHDSDEDLIATLYDIPEVIPPAIPPDVTGELLSTEVTGWGFGVVQRIEKIDADLYLGFRHYQANFDTVNVEPTLERRGLEDFFTVTAGVTIKFSDLFSDPDQMNLNNNRKNYGRNMK